jgi:hypothetical protein
MRPVTARGVPRVRDRVDADDFAMRADGPVRDVRKCGVRIGEEDVLDVNAGVADVDHLAAAV